VIAYLFLIPLLVVVWGVVTYFISAVIFDIRSIWRGDRK
jgi:hypothetical protein